MGLNTTGAANTNDYRIGRGTLYAAPLDAVTGRPHEYRDLGNVSDFVLTLSTDKQEHSSSRSGLKVVDKSVVINQKLTLKITLDELNFDNLALFFSGSTSATVANASAITSQAHSFYGKGRWYDVMDASGNRAYDCATITVATMTLGTDFTVDLKMGRIFVLSTSAGAWGSSASPVSLNVTTTLSGQDTTLDEVKALTQSSISLALKFISQNPVNGDNQEEYQFHQVTLSADGDLSLIGDDFSNVTLSGTAEKNTLNTLVSASPTLTIRTHSHA